MNSTIFFLVVAIGLVAAVLGLLRSRLLREKYAALWIVVGALVAILAIFPQLLEILAGWVGVAVPSNLLFALAILMLLGVALHLSLEVSRLDDETRVLSEEVGILRLQVHDLSVRASLARGGAGRPGAPTSTQGRADEVLGADARPRELEERLDTPVDPDSEVRRELDRDALRRGQQ